MRLLTYVLLMMAVACGGAPRTPTQQADLQRQADATLHSMMTQDPTLQQQLASSVAYVVFPSIGKGGFIAGGAHGQGVLYEQGQPTGFVTLSQASLGAQIGAQTFAQLIVFRNSYDVAKLKQGTYSLGGEASAVVLTAGAGAAASFTKPVAVFYMPHGGVMAELAVAGQHLSFVPAG